MFHYDYYQVINDLIHYLFLHRYDLTNEYNVFDHFRLMEIFLNHLMKVMVKNEILFH